MTLPRPAERQSAGLLARSYPSSASTGSGRRNRPSLFGSRPGTRGRAVGYRVLAQLLLLACGWGGIRTTQAFISYLTVSGQPEKWNLSNPPAQVHTNIINRGTHAIRYFLGGDAYSAANKTAELNAARACFDQWQAIPNTTLRFEEGGQVSGKLDVNTTDNTNLVYWTKTSTIVNNGLDNIFGSTGVTFSDFFSDGTLAEADIVLNGVQFTWFTDFNNAASPAQFVEAVLLHEVGHFIGLAHNPVGATTMFPRGSGGVNTQAGLSPDEIAAAHALYPKGTVGTTLATLTGVVTLRNSPVLGAVVTIEDGAGNIAGGTITRTNGRYQMPALVPGQYQARVCPVDSTNASYFLFRGADITPDFAKAEVNFLATTNTPVTLAAGATATLNFAVQGGTAAFRIGRLEPPTTNPGGIVVVNYPTAIPHGQADVVVGVFSVDSPGPNALLRVTGDGLTFGATAFQPDAFPGLNPPLNLLSVPVHIGPDATPGMRSLVVQQDSGLVYANGFLEIAPAVPDYNFDGLDDRFQRQYFPRWTVPESGPNADPDADGFNNLAEYISGTDPTDRNSVLTVQSVRVDASGATVTWPSAPGKRYQVLSRSRLNSPRSWAPIGDPVVSTGQQTQFLDSSATNDLRFYRIQALP